MVHSKTCSLLDTGLKIKHHFKTSLHIQNLHPWIWLVINIAAILLAKRVAEKKKSEVVATYHYSQDG